ncbi:MAG: T9SS type A sorting domain-containing protein [Sphingobacteriales bacterium]|nr:MAG: T9SS type A sorting domain-containing protein [Sphingobacteriales bacterium]
MKKLALLLSGLAIGTAAMAQISITGSNLTYSQDFNTLDITGTNLTNLPTGWSIYEWGGTGANTSYRAGDGSSNSGDTYSFGASGATERALGSLASGGVAKINYGASFTNNTGTSITGFSITFNQEQWRAGDANPLNLDSTRVFYSLTSTIADSNFTDWTEIPLLQMTSIIPIATGGSGNGLDGNLTTLLKTALETVNVPNGTTLTLRFYDWNSGGSDDANAIDDLSMTFITGTPPPPNYKPMVVMLDPADNSSNLPVSTTMIRMAFDRIVTKGTGSIVLHNDTDGTNQTFNVTSSAVTLSGGTTGDTVSITGITLAAGKAYHVTFDSTAFDTAGYKSYGVYDATTWNFSTTPGTATGINETFDAACATGSLPMGWTRENILGNNQQWNCAGTVGTDRYMQMNGFAGSANNDNEDWLITPAINMAGQSNTMLYFRGYKGFTGSDIDVLMSTNYSGTGDPNNATWNSLGINFSGATSSWATYSSVLNNSTNPVHIAFKYNCSAAGADCAQWRIDSVVVSGTASILSVKGNNQLPVEVLGAANSNRILVGFSVEKPAIVTASVYDLTGREVFRSNIQAQGGSNRVALTPSSLTPGMYIVRITNGTEYGVVKAIVE